MGLSGQVINLLVQTSNHTDLAEPQKIIAAFASFCLPWLQALDRGQKSDETHTLQRKETLDFYSLPFQAEEWSWLRSKTICHSSLITDCEKLIPPKENKIQCAKVFSCTGQRLTTTTCT